jgi:tRNA(Leu) C34 or U34 (ribose-2'-O)-methylase TrmL
MSTRFFKFIYGLDDVLKNMGSSSFFFISIFFTKGSYKNFFISKGVNFYFVPENSKVCLKYFNGHTVFAITKYFSDLFFLERLLRNSLYKRVVVFDRIYDPRNLGSCIRSCVAFGVSFIIVPLNRSCSITEVVNRSSSNYLNYLYILRVKNLYKVLNFLKSFGLVIIGVSLSENIFLHNLKKQEFNSFVLIFGSEGAGLRSLTKSYCNFLFSVSLYGPVDSLNLSVCLGICLYHLGPVGFEPTTKGL